MAPPKLLVFCSVLLLLCAWGLAQQAEVTAGSDVPAELDSKCTMVRQDDYQKPATISLLEEKFRRFTELKCRDECAKRPICGYANFNNRTRECRLVPQRAFHESYLSEQGLYVMWEKICPIEHIWNRTDDPAKMVMCPMLPQTQRLSLNYAYKFAKYISNDVDATWWCQRDPICKGVYRNATWTNMHVFLYKAVADANATGDISEISVKNCTPPGPQSGAGCFFTAYNRKTVRGESYLSKRGKNFRECYTMCQEDTACYAAYASEDRFRTRGKCQLYKKENVIELEIFRKEFDNAKVWLRDVCHE